MALVCIVGLAMSCSTTTPAATPDVPATDQSTPDDAAPDITDVAPPRDVAPLDVPATDVPATDVPAMDALDAAADLPAPMDRLPVDAAPDVARDAPPVDAAPDAPPADGATCTAAGGCHAFWCGCGRCNPRDITCTPDMRGCPLACVSACPELATAVCRCEGGRCGAPALADAGADAAADAAVDGGSPAGTLCGSTAECAAGLMCCYPCGIPGCSNRCIAPMGGRCPLFP